MQTSSLQPGTLLRERYRILEELGGGGYGIVYKARDESQSNRLVAIKQIIMLKTLSAQEKIQITDIYNREVTLLSALKHKSLPHMYDHFTDPECWYSVMQYIEGKTLEEHLEAVGRLSLGEVFRIGIKLCTVLDYLHRQIPPIIFRDVKPDNIMLTPDGDVFLIDFGIARRHRVGQRDTGALGTPGYAAPEQYGDAQTEPRTDVYGLGTTLQTLLTGKTPLEMRISGLPPAVFIPRGVQSLLEWMTEARIEERPRSMASVRWYLTFLEHNPQTLDDPDGTIASKRLAMKGGVLPQKPAHQPAKTRVLAQSLAPLQPQMPIQPSPNWRPSPVQPAMRHSLAPLQPQKPTPPLLPSRPSARQPFVQPTRGHSQAQQQMQRQAPLQSSTSKSSSSTFFLWDNVRDVARWIRGGIYLIIALVAIILIFQEATTQTLGIGFWISLILGIYLMVAIVAPVVSYLISVLLIMCWGILRYLYWVLVRSIRMITGW